MIFYLTALVVLVLDQLSKIWIRSHLAIGEYLFSLGLFRIIRIPPNTGAAFGIFTGYTPVLAAISLVSAVALLIGVIFFYRRYAWLNTTFVRFATGLALGGTLGNLFDRLQPELGGVTDFISFGIWPSFNVADSAIVIGVILFAINLMRLSRNNEL
ncbi:MAG: signal peptidase II [Chloroflexota bacterium]